MKKVFSLLTALIVFIMLAGCSAANVSDDEPESPELPAETPAPEEPTPEPPYVISIVSDGDPAIFADGVKSIADNADNTELIVTGGGIAEGVKKSENASAIIAVIYEENADVKPLEDALSNGSSVYVFDMGENSFSNGIMRFGYDTAPAQQLITEALLAMPSHDTPVRVLGMFTSASTDAASSFSKGSEDGIFFDKGAYFEDENDQTPEEWFDDMLKSYYPGMLDAVYAENERMAEAAIKALNVADRTDMEVISLYGSIPFDAMENNPYICFAEVCPHMYNIGARIAEAALNARNGSEVSAEIFAPEILYASEIKNSFAASDNG